MKILVTGANGFLGKIVTKKLVSDGHNVTALVLPEEDTTYLATLNNVKVIRGDLINLNTIKSITEGIDVVIHLAAIINSPDDNLNFKINYEGTKNIADLAEKSKVKRFIFTSSMTSTSQKPNAYGKSKKMAEDYLNKKPFRTLIIRPTLIYGKNGATFNKLVGMTNMLPLIVPIIGKGNSIKQPIYVDDAAEIIKRAVTVKLGSNKIYQIGGPEQITFRDLVKKILKIQNKSKKIFHVPRPVVWIALGLFEKITKNLPVTRESILELETDTKVDSSMIEKDFNIELRSLEDGIKNSL